MRATLLPHVKDCGEAISDLTAHTVDSDDAELNEALEWIGATRCVRVRYFEIISVLLEWFVKLYPPPGAADFLLDAAETGLALVPITLVHGTPMAEDDDASNYRDDMVSWLEGSDDTLSDSWRDICSPFLNALEYANNVESSFPDWRPDHDARLFRLFRWVDEPVPGARRHRPTLDVIFRGYLAGAATEADIYDTLIGPRAKKRYGEEDFFDLKWLTTPDRDSPSESEGGLRTHPVLKRAVKRIVERIVQVEIARGESATAASAPALFVQSLYGLDTLFDLIAALGKQGFARLSQQVSESEPAVLTWLIQHVFPRPADTPKLFAARAKEGIAAGRFSWDRIFELGLVNPWWVPHCAAVVGWPGYDEAVYWFIAHAPSRWRTELDWKRVAEHQWPWIAAIKSRTTLSAEQRNDGVVDVEWFHTAYKAVGSDQRWDAIENAAKFLDGGQGHKKAARLADVLLGRTNKANLIAGIRKKFSKEDVRLLGLLPLASDPAQRKADLAERYAVIKEYERYARGLSPKSKEPALLAARIALENLAQTAGYGDPIRLEWALTAEDLADLVGGSVSVRVKEFTVTLALPPLAEPTITFEKAGRSVKSLQSSSKSWVVSVFEKSATF